MTDQGKLFWSNWVASCFHVGAQMGGKPLGPPETQTGFPDAILSLWSCRSTVITSILCGFSWKLCQFYLFFEHIFTRYHCIYACPRGRQRAYGLIATVLETIWLYATLETHHLNLKSNPRYHICSSYFVSTVPRGDFLFCWLPNIPITFVYTTGNQSTVFPDMCCVSAGRT